MTIDHLSIVWTGEIYNYEFVPDGEGQEGPRFVLEKPLTNWMAIYMLFGISIGTTLGTFLGNVGLWHFTVPWLFGWASYIPYATLVVSINYVNLCFSFLLSGLSLILLLWGKKVFAKNKEAVVIYGFILLLWIFRVVMAIVCPCPPESNVWMSYGQLGGSVIVMFLLLVPFIRIAVAMRESKKGGI